MASSFSRYLVGALLAIAMLPAAAHAATAVPVPASDALTTSAHALAVARWGVDPCGGQVTVTWAHMGAGINARSQWMSVDVHDPSTYSQCSITYNLDIDWDWPKLCTVIEHELGHLAGHEHVDDPHNVMSPYYVFPTAECTSRQPGVQPAPAPVATAAGPGSEDVGGRDVQAQGRQAQGGQAQGEKRKAVRRKAVRRRGRAKAAAHAGSSAQFQMIGTPTLTVVDPIRLFEGDVFASSVFR